MKSQLPRARIFALSVSLLLSAAARADEPAAPAAETPAVPAAETPAAPIDPYAPGAPAPPSELPSLTKLERPVPSPLHPRHRMISASTMALGVYCPNFGSRSLSYGHYCTSQLHLGMDGRYGEIHASLLLGDVLRAGAILGFDMGTRYMQLGGKRSRVALALRGSFDVLAVKLGRAIPGQPDDGLLTFSNTYGPHVSIALNPRNALEIRGAVGWTVGGFWDNHDGFNKAVYALVAEGWIGMRFSP